MLSSCLVISRVLFSVIEAFWLHVKGAGTGNWDGVAYDEHIGLGAGVEREKFQGEYAYTRDLLRLESRRAPGTLAEILRELQRVRTLLRLREWERTLLAHSDREFCNYPLRGVT